MTAAPVSSHDVSTAKTSMPLPVIQNSKLN
jgi:hypothetical protein